MQTQITLEVSASLGDWLRDELAGDADDVVVRPSATSDAAALELGPGEAALVLTLVVNSFRLAEYGIMIGQRVNEWRHRRREDSVRVVVRAVDDDLTVAVRGEGDIERVADAVQRGAVQQPE